MSLGFILFYYLKCTKNEKVIINATLCIVCKAEKAKMIVLDLVAYILGKLF